MTNLNFHLTFEGLPQELRKQAVYKDIVEQDIVVRQGEIADSIHFLLSGQIRLVTFTKEETISHYFVQKGESFDEAALFLDTYAGSAIADSSSRVAIINKKSFKQALKDYPDLADSYMNQLSYRYEKVKILLTLRSIRSARERFIQYLNLINQSNNKTLILQRPLKYLAIELGLSADALYRTLSLLQSEGVITRKKRSITLNKDW